MGIVWHGHYLKYFEDGREAFGREHKLGYMDIYDQGYMAPVVNVNCSFKKYVKYGQTLVIETRFVNSPAAKIVFRYTIYDKESMIIMAEGESIQVFTNMQGELVLTNPCFFHEWKSYRGLITNEQKG